MAHRLLALEAKWPSRESQPSIAPPSRDGCLIQATAAGSSGSVSPRRWLRPQSLYGARLGNPNNFAERTNWITHTQNVLEVLEVARADAFFGVAAMQEYYRTGDLKQLEGLPGDFFWLQHQLAALRTLTSDNPAEQGRVEHLARLINRLVTLSRQLTLMARTHSVAQAAAEPDSAELSGGFGEVMRILREMTADEDRLMRLRTEAVRAHSRRSVATITTGSRGDPLAVDTRLPRNQTFRARARKRRGFGRRVARNCKSSMRLWSSG